MFLLHKQPSATGKTSLSEKMDKKLNFIGTPVDDKNELQTFSVGLIKVFSNGGQQGLCRFFNVDCLDYFHFFPMATFIKLFSIHLHAFSLAIL